MQRTKLVLAAVITTFTVTSCATGESAPVDSAVEAGTTLAAASETTTTSAAAVVPTVSGSEPATTGPVVPPRERGVEQELTLSDAHDPSRMWKQGSYQATGSSEPRSAVASVIECSSKRELEFRFAKHTGTLTFAVAQDLNSKNSTTTLQFSLLADQRAVDDKKIAFKDSTTLSTSLVGVSSVRLIISVAESTSNCTTTALLTSITIDNE